MADPIVLPWAIRISRAESSEVLDRLMDDWYAGMRTDRGLRGAIGFESHMEQRDWDSAKRSIERTYGRSNRDHEQTLDALAAAIQSRRILSHRLVGSRG